MDQRVMQLRIGLMVVGIGLITAILLVMIGGEQSLFHWIEPKQVFHVYFSEAPGVTRGTPVRKAGIRIGRVRAVEYAEDVDDPEVREQLDVRGRRGGVVVTIEIDRNRKIYSDEVCRVRSDTLMGDAVLVFVKAGTETVSGANGNSGPGGDHQAGMTDTASLEEPVRRALPPGTLLDGSVDLGPLELARELQDEFSTAIRSVADASDEIRVFVERVNQFLGTREDVGPREDQFAEILDTTSSTMKSVKELADNANLVVGDEQVRRDLKDSVAQFPGTVGEMRNTLDRASQTFDKMDDTISRLNNSLGNIERFTRDLGEQGPVMIERLERGSESLELLLGQVYAFSQALNSEDGTVGRLIRDPQLYENLNRAVANIEQVSRDLKPVVRDARVFSDKIARHPELLGVRGAIGQNAGTKGAPRLSELLGTSGRTAPADNPSNTRPR
jgi:phospholipid/cholesterol/gamma-HCH transport system substrate-binding protein